VYIYFLYSESDHILTSGGTYSTQMPKRSQFIRRVSLSWALISYINSQVVYQLTSSELLALLLTTKSLKVDNNLHPAADFRSLFLLPLSIKGILLSIVFVLASERSCIISTPMRRRIIP
jgi:hypothetical protein